MSDRDAALAEAAALGRPIDPKTNEGMMAVREQMAALADFYGPRWYPGEEPVMLKTSAPAAAPTGSPANANTPRPGAAAIAASKLALAASHPPNIVNAGQAGDPQTYSDARLLSMAREELLDLDARGVLDRRLAG